MSDLPRVPLCDVCSGKRENEPYRYHPHLVDQRAITFKPCMECGKESEQHGMAVFEVVDSPLIPQGDRLKAFVRKHGPGECRMLSKGNDCDCLLCVIDDLVQRAMKEADEV